MPSEEDRLFVQIAVEKGYLTPEQGDECFDVQKQIAAMGLSRSVRELTAEKGYLSQDQVRAVRREMAKAGVRPKIGGYEILSKLGEGAMGAVYKAKQLSLGRTVALKVLHGRLASDKEYLDRFRREATTAAKLHHPNIVHVFEFDEHGGVPYLAMEYVKGKPLSERCVGGGKMPEKEALQIVRQIALGLGHAAQAGIIHRDIKPANILMDAEGHAKLADLGLAKPELDEDRSLTRTGAVMGTPNYISPEQAKGARDLDIRSDIYSLGATLFHLVTAQVPFQGDSTITVINHHINTPLRSPRTVEPSLSVACCALIERMMAKAPEDRPQTPEELASEIDAALTGRATDETIAVRCRCGKSFQMPKQYEGRMGRCSSCGRQVAITARRVQQSEAPLELRLVDEQAELKAERQQEYDSLKEAIAADPTATEPHVQLADLCNEIGQMQEALEHYRTAYILDSSLKHVLDRIEAIGGPMERAKLEVEEKEEEARVDEFWRLLARAFVFPFAGTGTLILIGGGIFFGFMDLLLHMPQVGFAPRILAGIAWVVVIWYLVTYALDTIGHVANGRDDPPDWPSLTDLEEFFWLFLRLFACVVAAVIPLAIYQGLGGGDGWPQLVCLGIGLFYLPMCLLAVTILRTPLAVLPQVVFPPICRTHVRYVATVAVVFVAYGLAQIIERLGQIWFVSQFLMIYFLLVQMYAIGVFYRTNEETIGWLTVERDAEE